MDDDSIGNILYIFGGDQSIVSNENGDLFVRDALGNDHYTTAAGTKGDWLLRQYGDGIVVRDNDGIAYARVAGDQDRYISSLSRIEPTSSTNVATQVYTASPALVQSVSGAANLSDAALYDKQWREIAEAHPELTKQQVTDIMSERIWNNNYKALMNDIAHSSSPEEREQKIREHQSELDKYKASGIDVDNDEQYLRDKQGMPSEKIATVISNYSYGGIEHQYSVPPTSFVGTELTEVEGISKDKLNEYQTQKESDQNIINNTRQEEVEDFKQYVRNKLQNDGQKVTTGEGQTFLMPVPTTDSPELRADRGDNRDIVTYQKLNMDDGTTREIARLSDGSVIVRDEDGTVQEISKERGNSTYRPDGTLKETVKDGIKTTYGSDGVTVTASYTIEGPDYVAAAVSFGGTDAVTGQLGISMNLKNGNVYFNTGPSTPGGGKTNFALEAGKIVETGGQVLDEKVVDALLKEWSRSAGFTRWMGANYTWSGDTKALGLTIGYGGGYSESYGTPVPQIVQQIRDSDRVKSAVNLYEEGKMSLQGVLSTIQNEYNSIYTDEYRKQRAERGE